MRWGAIEGWVGEYSSGFLLYWRQFKGFRGIVVWKGGGALRLMGVSKVSCKCWSFPNTMRGNCEESEAIGNCGFARLLIDDCPRVFSGKEDRAQIGYGVKGLGMADPEVYGAYLQLQAHWGNKLLARDACQVIAAITAEPRYDCIPGAGWGGKWKRAQWGVFAGG